jgi:hypothetical protein
MRSHLLFIGTSILFHSFPQYATPSLSSPLTNDRVGFIFNYEYKYFKEMEKQQEDVITATQSMAKIGLTVSPFIPKDYFFQSNELKDFICTSRILIVIIKDQCSIRYIRLSSFTKVVVNNAILTATDHHEIVKKLYQRPCAHLIKV